ncbi:MAG TPA: aspartate carbamoyltransferase [Candidatus Acidoferrales bacterium]|jgi:aspartate carbamoyltransferase catalytic subunit|nr:aspartate carbamoyltransferase [Candidatus Acidoferrales bacterium]
MEFAGRDIVSIKDFSREEIDYVLKMTDAVEPLAKKSSHALDGKIMATLFFEPSTRTKLSFESAMYRYGGNCLGFAEPKSASVQKGENLADTVRVVESYADVLVIRHPLEGAARLAAEFASVPVINAGTGAEEHPTQAMLDLYTIRRELGKIDGLNIALAGDLRYGRTVHSLAYALSLYDINLYLVSPTLLRMRKEVLEEVSGRIKVQEFEELSKVLPRVDVLYMTRIQKERFGSLEDYEKVRGSYRLIASDLSQAKPDMIVMHPLPRVDEIEYTVDNTRHSKYFKQVWYGLLVRMSLIGLVLGALS